MIDHLELNVSNIERSTAFYRSALAPLGYDLHVPAPAPAVGFGSAPARLDFWLRSGDVSTPTPHFAFGCTTRDHVRRAHDAAIRAGGVDDGPPALLAHIHPSYFAGFVRDPDGHKVEFVCHATPTPLAPTSSEEHAPR
jgi:catechol 2,3-dioxygenase-like lactoylglutathione lyase family enzyme